MSESNETSREQTVTSHSYALSTELELNDALARLASARWWPEPEGHPHRAAFSIPVDEEHDADCILSRAIDELLALRRLAREVISPCEYERGFCIAHGTVRLPCPIGDLSTALRVEA